MRDVVVMGKLGCNTTGFPSYARIVMAMGVNRATYRRALTRMMMDGAVASMTRSEAVTVLDLDPESR